MKKTETRAYYMAWDFIIYITHPAILGELNQLYYNGGQLYKKVWKELLCVLCFKCFQLYAESSSYCIL